MLLKKFINRFSHIFGNSVDLTGPNFIRIGKSLIINRTYIYYINIPKLQLILSDGANSQHTLTASREALKQLKDLIDNDLK